MAESKIKSTALAQLTALCEQLKAAKAEMQPLTADQMAAVVVRTILIETASDAASDLVPTMWEQVPEAEREEVRKANRATRAELAGLIQPFITASSNTDKYARASKLLPAKPDTAETPEFA